MRARKFDHLLVAGLLALGCSRAIANVADCSELMPPERVAATTRRTLDVDDLVQLRDIGPVPNVADASVLSLSPDGSKVAFQIRRASLKTNSYCLGMFVMALRPLSRPELVDVGGEFSKSVFRALGFAAVSAGGMNTVTPKWSPDGAWIAFLRREQGVTQVWRAQADGRSSAPMTRIEFDVEDFVWARDGRSIVISGRPALTRAERDIDAEGRGGFLYDERFRPIASSRPSPREPISEAYFTVSVENGQAREATVGEQELIEPTVDRSRPDDAVVYAKGAGGQIAWTATKDASNVLSLTALHAKSADGASRTCETSVCERITRLWWLPDGRSLIYLRNGSRHANEAGLYRWTPGRDEPRPLLVTDDVLMGCEMRAHDLICAHEGATQPRRLVEIDLSSGRMKALFDPNPEFASIALGSVERFRWKNRYGTETFSDLVLPPDHRAGERHPLIVVQYESRGFLRGGTGDDYPIQLFAAHGYAVLSFQRPPAIGAESGAKSWDEVNRLERKDWIDRRNIQSSLETGIQLVAARGVADSARVGLTGLSDGASTAQFALINSKLTVAAVAISTCCDEPSTLTTLLGPAGKQWFNDIGNPLMTDSAAAGVFWGPVSLRMNAAQINTPILMQLADREYLGALESFTALRELNKPVEMYVFPDEDHVKWQPAHRAVMYQRSLDWFDFWLKGVEDASSVKAAQYQRWRALRDTRASPARAESTAWFHR